MQHIVAMENEPSKSPMRIEMPADDISAAPAVKQVQNASQQTIQSTSGPGDVPLSKPGELSRHDSAAIVLVEPTVVMSEGTEKSISTSEKVRTMLLYTRAMLM